MKASASSPSLAIIRYANSRRQDRTYHEGTSSLSPSFSHRRCIKGGHNHHFFIITTTIMTIAFIVMINIEKQNHHQQERQSSSATAAFFFAHAFTARLLAVVHPHHADTVSIFRKKRTTAKTPFLNPVIESTLISHSNPHRRCSGVGFALADPAAATTCRAKKISNSEEKADNSFANIVTSSSLALEETTQKKKRPTWDERYEQLKQFKKEYGHVNVPYQNGQLGQWVHIQRRQYKRYVAGESTPTTPTKIKKLESIGFEWDRSKKKGPGMKQNKLWDKRLSELEIFKREHGHTNVPYSAGSLGQWVARQRNQYKLYTDGRKSSLNDSRIKDLKAMGFAWKSTGGMWHERVIELRAYKEKHGHCDVPRSHPTLGRWVNSQRTFYKNWKNGEENPGIDQTRVDQLEKIGFTWPNPRIKWEDRIEELIQYKEKHGHFNVHRATGGPLGKWVYKQRWEYSLLKRGEKSSMTPEKIEALERIGFTWTSRKQEIWKDRLHELRAFQEENGHCNVPQKTGGRLGTWVGQQRFEYRKYKDGKKSIMTEERINALEELGFQWDVPMGRPWPSKVE